MITVSGRNVVVPRPGGMTLDDHRRIDDDPLSISAECLPDRSDIDFELPAAELALQVTELVDLGLCSIGCHGLIEPSL
jgi:hypothetical protein